MVSCFFSRIVQLHTRTMACRAVEEAGVKVGQTFLSALLIVLLSRCRQKKACAASIKSILVVALSNLCGVLRDVPDEAQQAVTHVARYRRTRASRGRFETCPYGLGIEPDFDLSWKQIGCEQTRMSCSTFQASFVPACNLESWRARFQLYRACLGR